MKTRNLILLGFAGLLAAGHAISQSAAPLADNEMGLSRTSVFDDPSPAVFNYPKNDPSSSVLLPRAYSGAPSQIPHRVEQFLPIRENKNMCLSCHDKPGMMGKKIKGIATPMPESHYNRVDNSWQRSNARFNCTQCHAPQAEVGDLVGNTFKPE